MQNNGNAGEPARLLGVLARCSRLSPAVGDGIPRVQLDGEIVRLLVNGDTALPLLIGDLSTFDTGTSNCKGGGCTMDVDPIGEMSLEP